MLALKLLFAFSGFGLLAMVAVVGYDIYLALELERLNRRAAVVLPVSALRRTRARWPCATSMKVPRRFASKIGDRCGCKRWQKPLRADLLSPQRSRPASDLGGLRISIFDLHVSGLACVLVNGDAGGALPRRRASGDSSCAIMTNHERLAHNDAGRPPTASLPNDAFVRDFVHRRGKSSGRALVGFGN